MKKIHLILVALSLVFSVTMSAQESAHKEKRMDKLKTTLGLTDAQATEMQLLFKETRKEKQSIKSNEVLSKEDQKKQIKALKESTDNDLKDILSDDQYTQFMKLKEEKGEARRQGRKDFKSELNLTEEQEKQMKEIKADAKVMKDDVRTNDKLSDTEKKDMLRTLRKETDLKVKSILSDEQYKTLQEHRKQKRAHKKPMKK